MTCNRSDLKTLGFWSIGPQNLPGNWIKWPWQQNNINSMFETYSTITRSTKTWVVWIKAELTPSTCALYTHKWNSFNSHFEFEHLCFMCTYTTCSTVLRSIFCMASNLPGHKGNPWIYFYIRRNSIAIAVNCIEKKHMLHYTSRPHLQSKRKSRVMGSTKNPGQHLVVVMCARTFAPWD